MEDITKSLGFNYGISAFETIKLVSGKLEYIEQHLKRLMNALDVINYKYDKNEIINKTEKYIIGNNFKDGIIKILVNDVGIFISYRKNNYTDKNYNNGFKLTSSDEIKISNSKYNIKSSNYMVNYLELKKAKNRSFDEILFINEKGCIVECATANIFFIKQNKIYTPSTKSGCLFGIMREKIIKNSKIIETEISKNDLITFEAAFITNSVLGIMPVSKIDLKEYDSSNNKTIKILMEKFNTGGYIYG